MAVSKFVADKLKQFESLKNLRYSWEGHWQEIADYVLPRKATVTKTRAKGDKRTELIYDATAIHALELLAASLHGMLTNPSTSWFDLKYRQNEINEDVGAKAWLDTAVERMYQAFSRSNFQQEIHELYMDLTAFGTACLFLEDDEGELRFSSRHVAEIFISENHQGKIDMVCRKFNMSASAAAKQWGVQAGTRIINESKNDPYKDVTILHSVYPRDQYDIKKKDKLNKPFGSCYIDLDGQHLIAEGGFDEFPFMVPRFLKSSNEVYGRSPSMTALPDIKMLNEMSKTTIKAAQKQVDPPLLVPDDGFVLPVRTVPGGLNYYRAGTRDRIEPLNIGANNPIGLNMEEQKRRAIREAFFIDQLLLGQGPQMTATEVVQRNEEKMRLLGPVLGRLTSELLRPLINRAFRILLRNEQLPPMPEYLEGVDIEIEYVSPLAKAQRTSDLSGILRALEIAIPLQQQAPVFDYINSDKLIKYIFDILGVPGTLLNDDVSVSQKREQDSMVQQQQLQQQQLAQAAESAGKAAPAVKEVANMMATETP